ncbi:LytTR family DNA-binding domain-containing protein [Sphingobacterium sp. InxBP1]|uniref:LytR/AlgR family response regulator transcription factor n=1 Tax=Sphingobacterium sp. InxBP1 TaxID=2870328 RepID=UPI002243F405|nr:LytTR family DNA-binding domain-containing protein [Sphingobacterium sp. InxBP1]MCW8313486.1 LytTR family DNA-binding domain-containing protein [Sphingobacterium sp. InxBP1]
MAKYDVVIIDDDPYDVRMAEKAFREIKQVGEVRSFGKAIEGFNAIIENPPDVLLLDVEMPQMSGLDLYQTLPSDKRPPVILYTKTEQYAYEGIKLAVADYLIKPVSFPDLYVAFKRALEQNNIHIKLDIHLEPSGKWFRFKHMDRLIKFSDIVALSSEKNYVVFHLRQAEDDFHYRLTMAEAEGMLPKSRFVRVHRGFIVNVDFASKIVAGQLVLPDRSDLRIFVSGEGVRRLHAFG